MLMRLYCILHVIKKKDLQYRIAPLYMYMTYLSWRLDEINNYYLHVLIP